MNIYSLDWLETALKNFKEQDLVVHMINGEMTMDEFLQKWCKKEFSKVVKIK